MGGQVPPPMEVMKSPKDSTYSAIALRNTFLAFGVGASATSSSMASKSSVAAFTRAWRLYGALHNREYEGLHIR